MNRTTGVLVPLDGSLASRRAIGPGLLLARQLGCPLELMTVHDAVRQAWERELDQLAEATGYDATEVALVTSSAPADVIASMAREEPDTLVCMATQGRGAMDRMLLGSVTRSVLGAGVSPVLLVGGACSPPDWLDRYEQLVVACDGGGRTAAAALSLIRRWARDLDLEVELLAVDAGSQGEPGRDGLARTVRGLAQQLQRDGIDAHGSVVADERPAAGIAAFVAERPASLVLVAPREHTGLHRLLVGSVTAEVLSSSPAPVLIV